MNLRQKYMEMYPNDDMGSDIRPDVSAKDLYQALESGISPYDTIGVLDSIVRERCFDFVAQEFEVGYDVIYDLWLKNNK